MPGQLATQGKQSANWVTAGLRKGQYTCTPGPEQGAISTLKVESQDPRRVTSFRTHSPAPVPVLLLTVQQASRLPSPPPPGSPVGCCPQE